MAVKKSKNSVQKAYTGKLHETVDPFSESDPLDHDGFVGTSGDVSVSETRRPDPEGDEFETDEESAPEVPARPAPPA